MNAIIIAAGDSKRISDNVKSTPKALINVLGKPIISEPSACGDERQGTSALQFGRGHY